ncbi:hypothetical protein CPB86DRAFT_812351 [Serendipita vermifera]|nr:hypothetical protein CPB86DRAFT_812351 [Serendipita vermifera]
MHTYRRLASTASSTSRSASTSVHHSATHNSTTTRLSRSSSTTSGPTAMAPSSVSSASSATPLAESFGYAAYGHGPSHGINVAIPTGISRSLASPSGSVSSNGRSSSSVSIGSPSQESYTRAELQTIAESLLAHVSFGPYHIACSPVPSSHIRQHLATSSSSASIRSTTNDATPSSFNNYALDKENMQGTTSALNPSNLLSSSSSSSIYNPVLLGPSARRQFEGKEGSHHHHHHPVSNLTLRLSNMSMTSMDSSATSTPTTHHPRARFTIGGSGGERMGETMERGRGMGRKAVVTTRREVSSQHERGHERDSRGRRGGVKELS